MSVLPLPVGIPGQTDARRPIVPGGQVRAAAGLEARVAREERARGRVRVDGGMNVVQKIRHVEMRDLVVDDAAVEIGLPAQAVIQRQARIDLPVVLRIEPQVGPLFVVVRDVGVGE